MRFDLANLLAAVLWRRGLRCPGTNVLSRAPLQQRLGLRKREVPALMLLPREPAMSDMIDHDRTAASAMGSALLSDSNGRGVSSSGGGSESMTERVGSALLVLALSSCSIDDRILLVNDLDAGSDDPSGIEPCSGTPHASLITDFSTLQDIETAVGPKNSV
jgi:hypothetical protein